jgi:metallo-beta-lactamase class B
VVLVRHAAPGHTPGGSSWSWESEEQGHRVTVVYADSLNAVSAPAFHYLAGSQKNLSDLRQSIRRVHDLPCDILLAPHPDFTGMFEARDHMRAAPTTNAFVQANACRRYAEAAEVRLNARLEQERGEGPATAPWTH